MIDRERAIKFCNSQRGQYIISQALWYAICVLEQVQPPYKEPSNITDMRFLRKNLFQTFAPVEEGESQEHPTH